MAQIFEISEQFQTIGRELLRRIGYTNGLSDVWRFARVVEYLYPRIPCAVAVLRAVILDREKGINGADYAQGIIDVARALGLLEQAGAKLSLSARGYALHALEQLDTTGAGRKAFLLMSIIEFDGECTLNLLDLYARGEPDGAELGKRLVDRLFGIMDAKREWAKEVIRSNAVRDAILGELSRARSKLEDALDTSKKRLTLSRTPMEDRRLTPDQRVLRFLEHTVVPRRGWLIDLGCMERSDTGFRITEEGSRLLDAIRANGCYRDGRIILPLSQELTDSLQIENLLDVKDLFWRIAAEAVNGRAVVARYNHSELLDQIKLMYRYVKLYGFNEAETAAVFHVISAMDTARGRYIPQAEFAQQISDLVRLFPKEMFLLRQRRGHGGYIALKRGT